MNIKPILLAGLLGQISLASPFPFSGASASDRLAQRAPSGGFCGTTVSDDSERVTHSDALEQRDVKDLQNIIVPTYFHVVTKSDSCKTLTCRHGGQRRINQRLQDQLAYINREYQASKIQFDLKGTTITRNTEWSTDPTKDKEMAQALRKGDYATLNIFFVHGLGDQGIAGLATLPREKSQVDSLSSDTVRVLIETLPDEILGMYNRGDVTAHEVGHWLNLPHIDPNHSCPHQGDYVDDIQKCPSSPGSCPYHNLMDGSAPDCKAGLTQKQTKKMHNAWETRRG